MNHPILIMAVSFFLLCGYSAQGEMTAATATAEAAGAATSTTSVVAAITEIITAAKDTAAAAMMQKKDDKMMDALVDLSNKNLWDKAAAGGLALNGYRKSTFRYTYEHGTRDFLYYITDHGVNPFYTDGEGKNELMYLNRKSPFTSDYKKIADRLLKNGCNINQIDDAQHSVLENVLLDFESLYIGTNENKEKIRYLLEKDAPVRRETFSLISEKDCTAYGAMGLLKTPIENLDGIKPYNCAGAAYLGDMEYIRSHKESLHGSEEEYKRTLFYTAAFGDKAALTELLAEEPAIDYNMQDSRGNSLLMAAAYTGNKETFLYLYDKTDPSLVNSNEETLFTAALCGENKDIINLLLTQGESVLHSSKEDGDTFIFFQQNAAVSCLGDREVMEWYIKNYDAQEGDWFMLCTELLDQGQLELLELALKSDKWRDDERFWNSILSRCGTLEEAELMFKYMPEEAKRDHKGTSMALSQILSGVNDRIKENSAEIVKAFYNNGISLDSEDKIWVPVVNAAEAGDTEAVKELIRLGADLDARQRKDGRTAVMIAAMGDSIILKELLAAGADVNLTDQNGNTALMIAVSWGQKDCADLLLRYGADPDIEGDDGIHH